MIRSLRPPLTPLDDFEAFAVDSSSIQLSIRGLRQSATVEVDDRVFAVDPADGVVVLEVDGLAASTRYDVVLRNAGGDHRRIEVSTRADIGVATTRIATISDVHLGLEEFGLVRKLRHDGQHPYALHGALAAIGEAEEWGAELLVIKGDLCESGTRDEWDMAAELIEAATIPVVAIPGNHEVLGEEEMTPAEGFARCGLDFEPVQIVDREGVRLVAADTSIPGRGAGTLRRVADGVLEAAGASDRPVLLAIHHNVERLPVPWFWPPGIPAVTARGFLDRLSLVEQPVFMTSGHTHRNRRHHLGRDGALLFTEVSATSDYPGVWAGYEVTPTAIRQTVRRIADPDVVRWTERTRRAVGGIWPRWSQGRLDDRCVDLPLR